MMQALVYAGPEDLRVTSRSEPELPAGGAILRVRACGICGTDLKIAAGGHRAYPPGTERVPGHEIVGEIVALDGERPGLQLGEQVFVAPNLGCGICPACRAGRPNLCADAAAFGITFDGGFQELMAVPGAALRDGNLMRIPESVDPAAISIVEPLACALRGQRAVALAEGDATLICGAGPIGLLHVLVARAAGASPLIVSEPHERRRAEALQFGADAAVDPVTEDITAVVAELTDGRGADVVITAVPVGAVLVQALELAAVGGRINFFGGLPRDASQIGIDANLVHYRELQITGTTANDVADCRRALELGLSGQLDLAAMITARYPLADAQEAFAQAGTGRQLKVVVEP